MHDAHMIWLPYNVTIYIAMSSVLICRMRMFCVLWWIKCVACVLYGLHMRSLMYSVQCILYNVECTVYNVRRTLNGLKYIPYNDIYFIQHKLHHAIYDVQWTSAVRDIYSIQRTSYVVYHKLCTIHCTVYVVQCTSYNICAMLIYNEWRCD